MYLEICMHKQIWTGKCLEEIWFFSLGNLRDKNNIKKLCNLVRWFIYLSTIKQNEYYGPELIEKLVNKNPSL